MRKVSRKKEDNNIANECNFLVKVIADHLAKRQTEQQEDVNWGALFNLSIAHQVSAIVYKQCKTFIPKEFERKFKLDYSAALFYYENRVRDVSAIKSAFDNAGIPFFTIKGLDVAGYYPVAALRTMGDCDIVVNKEDTEKAISLLRTLGFVESEEDYPNAWTCHKDGRSYELHDVLVTELEYKKDSQISYFNNFAEYFKNGQLDRSFNFIFLLSHLRKHFSNVGAGIRMFADIAVIAKNDPGLEWDKIEQKLKELELDAFAHACYSIIEKWFDVTVPVDFARLSDADMKIIFDKVMDNGIFGYADAENRHGYDRNSFVMSKFPIWIKRIGIFFKRTFLNYNELKVYPGCEYLNGRPYLLPVAWIHRFVILLKHKDTSTAGETMKAVFMPKKEIQKQKEILEIMGCITNDGQKNNG